MKPQEIKELTVEEIQLRLEDFLDELANLRIQQTTQQLSNPSRVKIVKKNIARIKTILKENELGITGLKTASKA